MYYYTPIKRFVNRKNAVHLRNDPTKVFKKR